MTSKCKSIICCVCLCCCILLAVVSIQNSSFSPFASDDTETKNTLDSNTMKDSLDPNEEASVVANLDSINYITSGVSSYPGTSTGPGVLNGYNATPSGYYDVDVVGKKHELSPSEIFYNPNKF